MKLTPSLTLLVVALLLAVPALTYGQETIFIPDSVIDEDVTHFTDDYYAQFDLWYRNGNVPINTHAFTATIDQGDTLRARFDAPVGKLIRGFVDPDATQQKFWVSARWSAGTSDGNIPTDRPVTITFENLSGPEPVLVDNDASVTFSGNFLDLVAGFSVPGDFSCTAIIFEMTETVNDPAVEKDYEPSVANLAMNCEYTSAPIERTLIDIDAPGFEFRIQDVTTDYYYATGEMLAPFGVWVDFSILQSEVASGPADVDSFSFSVAFDNQHLELMAAVATVQLLNSQGGSPPDFFQVQELEDGFTVGCVIDFDLAHSMNFATEKPVVEALFRGNSAELQGTVGPVLSQLSFAPLGTPPVNNELVSGNKLVSPTLGTGTLTLNTNFGLPFIRGDVDATGDLSLLDIILGLGYMFTNQEVPCARAVDANGDQIATVVDVVLVLNYLFGGGEPPAAPFPDCGGADEGSLLHCEESSCP